VQVLGALAGRRVSHVAAGEYHTLALTEKGEVFAWGSNGSGALGAGDRADSTTPRQMLLPSTDAQIISVAAGGGHTLLLTSDGRVFAVGRGRSGQLGRGDALESVAAYRVLAVEVTGLGGAAISVAAGRDHSLAVVNLLTGQATRAGSPRESLQ